MHRSGNFPWCRAFLLALVSTTLGTEALLAQAQRTPPSTAGLVTAVRDPVPRVGVVLSGGSAKGLAHIGVLRVLEELGVPVDVVTGTSMGSLIGGLYAIGYTPDALEHIVVALPWERYFRDDPERSAVTLDRRLAQGQTLLRFPIRNHRVQLPGGVLTGQNISELLSRLTWPAQLTRDFKRFPTPFTAVATDLETGAAVPMDSGSLATALRASMSISSVFKPAERNGRLLIDGGVARNLPAQDAIALGANVLICSDVSGGLQAADELQSLVAVLDQTVGFQMDASTRDQRKLCDVYIRPDISGISSSAFAKGAEWTARGEAAARAVMPQLQAIAAAAAGRAIAPRPNWQTAQGDSVQVAGVVVRGVSGKSERLARSALAIPKGAWVTPDTLRRAIGHVFATGLFDRVIYSLEPSDSGTVVVITAVEGHPDRLGFGIRYDDRYKASILVSLELRNQIRYGSATKLRLRLGEQFQLEGQYLLANARASKLVVGAGARYTDSPIDIIGGDGLLIAEADVRVTSASALVGRMLGDHSALGVRFVGERSRSVAQNALVDKTQTVNFGSAALLFIRDGLDAGEFPTRGVAVYAKSEWSAVGADFSHHVLDARTIFPVGSAVAISTRLTAGLADGGQEVPVHYAFFLGGAYDSPVFPESHITFVGLEPEEMFGASVQRASLGLQWQARPRLFATARVDAGYASRTLHLDLDKTIVGAGAGLGLRTPFGPVEFMLSGRRIDALRLELNVGHSF
jgi:NTE family protein